MGNILPIGISFVHQYVITGVLIDKDKGGKKKKQTNIDKTVTSGLRADQRTTPGDSLSSQDTLELVLVGLVGTEEVSDLTTTNTDITSRNISELADMLGELTHERIAEAADLVVRLSLGVEVRSSLATTHVD